MSLLKAYLNKPSTQRVLSRKPGEKGFSLIELVVVVAVLAILAAIAIPSFTSINNKARASAASNTVATIAKECAVKYANGVTSPTYASVTLDGYTNFTVNGSGTNCAETGDIEATSSDTSKYPTFKYTITTGIKSCTYSGTEKVGCTQSKW
jgi:type IV pilus assembly protein PilA